LTTGAGNANTYLIQEIVFQSLDGTKANAYALGSVSYWTPSSNTLSVINIAGEFVANNIIKGNSSNAQYKLVSYDPLNNPANIEVYDNQYINLQGGNILDKTEKNPFGNI
jgi:hypothetical protein